MIGIPDDGGARAGPGAADPRPQVVLREAVRIRGRAKLVITARYAASPGVPAGLAPQVFAHLTPADLVLFLQVSPEEALRRKGGFTPLETGRTGSTGQAFVSYQDDVGARLREQAGQEGWETIDVTGLSPGSVLDQALAMLKTRLGIA